MDVGLKREEADKRVRYVGGRSHQKVSVSGMRENGRCKREDGNVGTGTKETLC